METVLSSPSRTVVIGPGRPFCVIGERINPTGRKKLQAELQQGDLSRLEVDVAQQVAGGADMLDVNVGDPLADEVGLMGRAVPLVQGLTELPLCIDSSVIEALEAGLSAYDGKALVNSVTGEDERLGAILPIVARHGAAVIGLANDDEIPMEPQRRLEVAKKIVSAAGDHGIPPEDVVIDPLAMPVGAEPRAVTLFLETLYLLREELGVNTTCGASNTSFGLPGRDTLGASFLAIAASHGLTSAIMDARSAEIVQAVRASDFLLGKDEWGANWIAAFRAKQAAAAAAVEATGVGSTEPARSAAVGFAGGGAGR
jgi:5-methyltetrahydrofolate--homocysteine methyltransferase